MKIFNIMCPIFTISSWQKQTRALKNAVKTSQHTLSEQHSENKIIPVCGGVMLPLAIKNIKGIQGAPFKAHGSAIAAV